MIAFVFALTFMFGVVGVVLAFVLARELAMPEKLDWEDD